MKLMKTLDGQKKIMDITNRFLRRCFVLFSFRKKLIFRVDADVTSNRLDTLNGLISAMCDAEGNLCLMSLTLRRYQSHQSVLMAFAMAISTGFSVSTIDRSEFLIV